MTNSQNLKDPIRDEILNGAKELFERFGFKKTTMEDIARQIGKSKSSLYYYYKTKEEIFEAVVLSDIDAQRAITAEAVQKVEPAPEKFRVLFTTMLKDVKEKANRFSFFRADVYENPFLLSNIIKHRDIYIEELLKDILILGISRQEVKVMNNAEMGLWAKTINLTMKSIGSRIFLEDDSFSEEQLTFLANTLFNGVRP